MNVGEKMMIFEINDFSTMYFIQKLLLTKMIESDKWINKKLKNFVVKAAWSYVVLL